MLQQYRYMMMSCISNELLLLFFKLQIGQACLWKDADYWMINYEKLPLRTPKNWYTRQLWTYFLSPSDICISLCTKETFKIRPPEKCELRTYPGFSLPDNYGQLFVMGSYSMPLYCVPLFIALVGPYYIYRIRTILALKLHLRFSERLVLVKCTKVTGFAWLLGGAKTLHVYIWQDQG